MRPADTLDPMQRAHALAQSGDLNGAATLCREVLARTPAHFYALFMLGNIESRFKRYEEAERLLKRAVEREPKSADALTAYGDVLIERKKFAPAVEALSRAISLQPRNPHALILHGLALGQIGKHAEAVKDFDAALVFDPRSVFALHNRANALLALKRHDEAKASVDALLKLEPKHLPAQLNRLAILKARGAFAEMLSAAELALKLEPGNAELWQARGDALHNLGQYDAALISNAKAVELRPDLAEAYLGCANALMEQQRLDEALVWCDRLLRVKPDYASGHLLRANILLHSGRPEQSLAAYDAAVAAAPDYADAHYHRGSAHLLLGHYREGWKDFEYRWDALDCAWSKPELNAPEWRGQAIAGKSIVIYCEQGLGDTVQFVRFLPELTARGAKVTFLCYTNLLRLFKSFAPEIELIDLCDRHRRFDFKCALTSLPLHFGTELNTLPNTVPYLFAEPERVAAWRERIGVQDFKIGIGWQGNPKGQIDKGRSIPLAAYRPLSLIPGVRLISLQRNHGLDQLAHRPRDMHVETLGEFDRGDDGFIDSTAIMQSLDLTVTSDTAMAHIAGALARPAWVGLKHTPDWRWMLNRSDSPWYPTLRLFRQKAPGDWDSVFAEMADALSRREGRAP